MGLLVRGYNLYFSPEKEFVGRLRNVLGFTPSNISLYKLAFVHKSAAEELPSGNKNSYERLEFLGDAVLGAVIAELLFQKYPFKDEGFLTKTRSKIVSRKFLTELAGKMGIQEFLQYNKKAMPEVNKNHAMNGDAFEALLGAVFMDRGFKFTRKFILKRIIFPFVDVEHLADTEMNFKSKLIEWSQAENKVVRFELVGEVDSGKRKMFKIKVLIDDVERGAGLDYNKKNAEKIAAEKACETLGL